MNTRRRTLTHCLGLGLGLAFASLSIHAAQATPITYTEQATASGTIGVTSFTNALITFTFLGDTSNVTASPGFFTNAVGTATIAGIGPATFTDSMFVFDNQGSLAAGFGDTNNGGSLLDTFDNAFSTYDLTTAIGPITNTPFYRTDLTYQTNIGALQISSVSGNATFTATLNPASATPEPASMLPMAFGLLGLGGLALVAKKRKPVDA